MQIFRKLVLARPLVREVKYGSRQASAKYLRPPEDFLFDHLEEAFRIHTRDFDLRLETAYLIRPRHGLPSDTIWSELHQGFVDRIENAFVENMDGFPDLKFLRVDGRFARHHRLFSYFFDLQVQIDR